MNVIDALYCTGSNEIKMREGEVRLSSACRFDDHPKTVGNNLTISKFYLFLNCLEQLYSTSCTKLRRSFTQPFPVNDTLLIHCYVLFCFARSYFHAPQTFFILTQYLCEYVLHNPMNLSPFSLQPPSIHPLNILSNRMPRTPPSWNEWAECVEKGKRRLKGMREKRHGD